MAIINCPGCMKKVSDRAAVCDHCGFMLGAHDTETLARKARNQRSIRVNKLVSQQMLAIVFFVAGIGATFYDWQESGWESVMPIVGPAVAGLSFAWYLVTRGRIYLLKRQK